MTIRPASPGIPIVASRRSPMCSSAASTTATASATGERLAPATFSTAGSGILHQEMPAGDAKGRMHGFQLWANLPAHLKMTRPRYQDVPASAIPEVIDDDGTRVRVICGDFWGKAGPVAGVAAEPRYLDVTVPAGRMKRLK